jgi:hypothetical protein
MNCRPPFFLLRTCPVYERNLAWSKKMADKKKELGAEDEIPEPVVPSRFQSNPSPFKGTERRSSKPSKQKDEPSSKTKSKSSSSDNESRRESIPLSVKLPYQPQFTGDLEDEHDEMVEYLDQSSQPGNGRPLDYPPAYTRKMSEIPPSSARQ